MTRQHTYGRLDRGLASQWRDGVPIQLAAVSEQVRTTRPPAVCRCGAPALLNRPMCRRCEDEVTACWRYTLTKDKGSCTMQQQQRLQREERAA